MKFKIFAVLLFLILSTPNIADASNYAWSESLGYFDFSDVVVSSNSLSGYAYNDNSGFLNMSGVSNNGSGDLEGYAWSESLGYFDFSDVTISNNQFSGFAYNDNSGFLNMSGVFSSWDNAGGSSGTSVKRRVESLESQDKEVEAENLREKYSNFFTNDPRSWDLKELTRLLTQLSMLLKNKSILTNGEPSYVDVGYYRDLEQGMEGEDVKKLQNYLIKSGYIIPDGVTGFFGAQTRQALINFQRDKQIDPAAGYFGPITKNFIINI